MMFWKSENTLDNFKIREREIFSLFIKLFMYMLVLGYSNRYKKLKNEINNNNNNNYYYYYYYSNNN